MLHLVMGKAQDSYCKQSWETGINDNDVVSSQGYAAMAHLNDHLFSLLFLRHWNFVSLETDWTARSVVVFTKYSQDFDTPWMAMTYLLMFVVIIPIHNSECKTQNGRLLCNSLFKENKNHRSSVICPFYFNFALASLEFSAISVSEKAALPRTTIQG